MNGIGFMKSILLANDGQFDTDEQSRLNQLNDQIDQINARLAEMKAAQQGGLSLFKRKSKCDRMREKWQEKIIEPFSQQIEQYQAATAQDLYNYADNLAQQYFDKYSKRRWFNPQKGPTVSDNYLNYIGVFSINRSFEIRRDVQLNEYSEYEELPSTYNGILKQSMRKAIQVALDDIIEIEVPQSSQYQLILNGQLDYLLDSYDIPDTFVLSDNSQTIYSATLSGTNQKASIPFGQLNGNLKIDVQWTFIRGVDATRRGVLVVCLEQGLQFGGIDCWGCWVVETDEQDLDGDGQSQKRR